MTHVSGMDPTKLAEGELPETNPLRLLLCKFTYGWDRFHGETETVMAAAGSKPPTIGCSSFTSRFDIVSLVD